MKQWFQSKTNWLGFFLVIIGILSLVHPLASAFFSPEDLAKVDAVVLFLSGGTVMILRTFFTDTAIVNPFTSNAPQATSTASVTPADDPQPAVTQVVEAHIAEKTLEDSLGKSVTEVD